MLIVVPKEVSDSRQDFKRGLKNTIYDFAFAYGVNFHLFNDSIAVQEAIDSLDGNLRCLVKYSKGHDNMIKGIGNVKFGEKKVL
jgi:hypothetical protein